MGGEIQDVTCYCLEHKLSSALWEQLKFYMCNRLHPKDFISRYLASRNTCLGYTGCLIQSYMKYYAELEMSSVSLYIWKGSFKYHEMKTSSYQMVSIV